MKIEKLRKNHKKEIIIGTILIVVIGGALTFKLTHSKYRTTQSIDLATGTINYKPYDFKIMAMYKSDDGTNYSEITDRMPSTGYVINTGKSYCTLDNINHDTEVELKTENGKHVFNNLTKSDKCYLYFDKIKITNVESLIANLTINNYSPNFNSTATTDEGVFQTSDGMYGGTTYYWRGAVENNYVKFAGYCWRIIRINGDGTLRLIYDGSTCHANGTETTDSIAVTGVAYNTSSDQSNYVGWTYEGELQRPSNNSTATASNAKTQTETWYNNNIGNNSIYSNKVADGKFCNDREIGSGSYSATGSVFYYAGYKRLVDSRTPTFNCSNAGDVYQLKVGAITVDEITFAGGVYNTANTSYYLYNGQYYWTMSPYNWDSDKYARVFIMNSNGSFYHSHMSWPTPGLRPVINLKVYTMFSSGDGTQNNPYVVAN